MAVNEIDIYNEAVEQLKLTPNSPALQHRAVLSLAQVGSLDFALSEHKRYKLDKLTHHPDVNLLEDIIGLHGRLLKDLHLSNSGEIAKNYARQSSEKYEQAFKLTGGYYSAINAATMAFIADIPQSIVKHRAEDILRSLPATGDVDSETRYFIEATRAEAALLLGNQYKAQRALKTAIEHDPQNYAAHSTTLRQLYMILQKRNESSGWLAAFSPPAPMHFAGHLFKIGNPSNAGELELSDYQQLRLDISDTIQRNNIGFGFGALAAGADITFAEVLLEEGGVLHAILPVNPELFIEHSVRPFDQDWVERFTACWEAASTRHVISTQSIWPNAQIDDYASRVAMGKTVQMAQRFSVESQQLLLWDKRKQLRGTAKSGFDWAATGRKQSVLPYLGRRRDVKDVKQPADISIKVTVHQKNTDEISSFISLTAAINHALNLQSQQNHQLKIGLHVDVSLNKGLDLTIAKTLSNKALPGSIFVSEAAASLLSFKYGDKYTVDYVGLCDALKDPIRIFALKPRPELSPLIATPTA